MLLTLATLAQAASFETLDLGDGRRTYGGAICHDGDLAVGQIGDDAGNVTGYAWHADGTVDEIAPLASRPFIDLTGCAGDTIIGTGYNAADEQVFVRIVGGGAPEDLGDIAGGGVTAVAAEVSDDGKIVGGGYDSTNDFVPVVWDGSFVALELPAATAARGTANGISYDGETIVGGLSLLRDGYGASVGVVWDADGVHELADTPDLWGYTSAAAVSGDGHVAVGSVVTDQSAYWGYEAARWVDYGPAEPLGALDETYYFSDALAVDEDGDVIVGRAGVYGIGEEGFYWTPDDGMRRIADVADEIGVVIPDDVLITSAYGVSADGLVVVGTAIVGGEIRAYRLDLRTEPIDTGDTDVPVDTDVQDTDVPADTDDTDVADTDASDTDVGEIKGSCGCNGGSASWVGVIALGALGRRKRA